MPCNPKKCCGKNVMFTPKNIMKKWDLDNREGRDRPTKRGIQYVRPPKIAKTAPIDNT